MLVTDLLYIEAVGNYVKVYQLRDGRVRNDMLRATSKQIEHELAGFPMIVRCHRAFLVNLQQVERIVSKSGSMQLYIKHSHEYIPVSRSNMAKVKDVIKGL
ncbi:MAG: LytTR family transcriptional regulator DNA-binding domain-containing protein [Prevotella sp.]|nr:LytTR family transcriptional regulator DNA-binding domain-containing protein [Prevotella sp.]